MRNKKFCCPLCKSSVKKQKNFLVCPQCKRLFPILDNIYDFFIPGSLPPQDELTGKFFEKIFKLFNSKDREDSIDLLSLRKLFGFKPKDFRGKKILDAGTGFGRIVKEICSYNPDYIIGLDIAMDSLKTAKDFVNDKRAIFVHADLNNAPFPPETFDWVISLGVIHHVSNFEKSLHNLIKLCKPNGRLLIAVLGRKGLIPSLRSFFRIFTLKIPFPIVERGLKYLPISPSWKYTISDTLWTPIYHQKSFEQMESLLKQHGVKTVRKLNVYREHSYLWQFLQGEGFLHLLATKEDSKNPC